MESKALISRRKLLASLGIAGVALASEGVLGKTGFVKKALAATVTSYAVEDIANLRTISSGGLAANDLAIVEGYYGPDDEGGGKFYWDSASSASDNGGTVILPTGHSGSGRWIRIITP